MLSILIIDDEAVTREKLSAMLRKSFFSNIYAAADAGDALSLMEEKAVDIVLLDVKLPDVNGLDLIQTLRSRNPRTEIVIITGYGTQEIAIESLRKGAIDYIEKPIKIDELMAALGRAKEKLLEKSELSYKNTLLIIDDEIETAATLTRELAKAGYDVFKAVSGQEALTILDQHKVDVIITDIVLKELSGIEILKQAKKIQQDVEGIMITGFSDNELTIKALRAGAFDYILKPVHFDILLISIEKALEKIKLYRNNVYRNRELKITSEIITKVNEDLEKRIKERSAELSQTQAQLFQTSKLATLGEMAAGLAHELNQPLGAIALTTKYLQRLFDGGRLEPDDLVKAIGDIDHSIKRMTSVIQHIRTFARQDTLQFAEVNLNETVEAALAMLGEQLRLHEIEVIKDLAGGLKAIAGEPFQLEQVWLNLLTNARHALDEKAELLSRRREGDGYRKRLRIATRYQPATDRVVIEVADNGVGMSEEVKNKIFEPFFTTKKVGHAMGLGMSISYGIISSHNGAIEIEGREGEGAVVRVLFAPYGKACPKS